jgi:hypothetical protein
MGRAKEELGELVSQRKPMNKDMKWNGVYRSSVLHGLRLGLTDTHVDTCTDGVMFNRTHSHSSYYH